MLPRTGRAASNNGKAALRGISYFARVGQTNY
jgi:hypothetical protein